MPIDKKINLDLTKIDGNAFSLMGNFQRQAKKEGWTQQEINEVLKEAQTSDYANLVTVLNSYCEVEDDEY